MSNNNIMKFGHILSKKEAKRYFYQSGATLRKTETKNDLYVCPSGRLSFTTALDAKRAIYRVSPSFYYKSIFRCPYCGNYHFSTKDSSRRSMDENRRVLNNHLKQVVQEYNSI